MARVFVSANSTDITVATSGTSIENAAANSALTLKCWIRLRSFSTPDNQFICGAPGSGINGWGLVRNRGGAGDYAVSGFINVGGFQDTPTITLVPETWYCLVMRWSSGNTLRLDIFNDDSGHTLFGSVATGVITGTTGTGDIFQAGGPTFAFGDWDQREVTAWASDLNSGQVTATVASAADDTTAMVQWHMSSNSINSATTAEPDASGHGNLGVYAGSPAFVDGPALDALFAESDGTSTVSGILKGTASTTITSTGIATISAILHGVGNILATNAGIATVSGNSQGIGNVIGISNAISLTTADISFTYIPPPPVNISYLNTFNINQIHIIATPASQNVFNQFDQFGLLIGLPRFNGEKIEQYKKRLYDVYTNRANSTYLGLVNGITRELGLNLFNPFRIYPIEFSGVFIAENPVVIFNGPYVELWRDKENNILEMEIDRFNTNGDGFLIKELTNFINSRSIYFRTDTVLADFQFERSMTILNQTNVRKVISENIPATQRFTLEKPGLTEGQIISSSIVFSDTSIFKTLVVNVASVINNGDYYININTGDVVTKLTPPVGITVQYMWIDCSFKPVASPVIIHDVESPNFKRKMFNQVLDDAGIYHNGMPTEYGAEIINELLSLYPLYYGI